MTLEQAFWSRQAQRSRPWYPLPCCPGRETDRVRRDRARPLAPFGAAGGEPQRWNPGRQWAVARLSSYRIATSFVRSSPFNSSQGARNIQRASSPILQQGIRRPLPRSGRVHLLGGAGERYQLESESESKQSQKNLSNLVKIISELFRRKLFPKKTSIRLHH